MEPAEFLQALKALRATPHNVGEMIGVSRRQAYRYASGESNISPAMAKLIRMLLKQNRLKRAHQGRAI